MARSGQIRQNSDGSYDQRYVAVKNAPRDVDKQSVSSSELRSSYSQSQYREQSRSQNKESQDVAHKVALETLAEMIKHTPGSLSQEKLDALKRDVNQFSNFNMKGSDVNRSSDRFSENRINRELSGESVESPSFKDKQKLDLMIRTSREIAKTCDPQTKSLWNNFTTQLETVGDRWDL